MRARAWCRVDLAGGTLDIWPLGMLRAGSRTVNVAIDLAARVELTLGGAGYRVRQGEVRREAATAGELARDPETALVGILSEILELPPFSAVLESDSPRGAGLGASSALAVAFVAAAEAELGRPPSTPARRTAVARDAEARLMQLPTGVQDQYPGLLGGALEILQQPGGEAVRPLAVDLEALGDRLLVVYTGTSHFSAGQNWEVVRRRLNGDPESVALFDGIVAAAEELPAALEAGDWPLAGALVSREWSFRRRLAEGISTPEIERLLATAADLGAWGGKACGAGGGGCVAVLCPEDRKHAISGALEAAGGQVLAARPAASPLSVG